MALSQTMATGRPGIAFSGLQYSLGTFNHDFGNFSSCINIISGICHYQNYQIWINAINVKSGISQKVLIFVLEHY